MSNRKKLALLCLGILPVVGCEIGVLTLIISKLVESTKHSIWEYLTLALILYALSKIETILNVELKKPITPETN